MILIIMFVINWHINLHLEQLPLSCSCSSTQLRSLSSTLRIYLRQQERWGDASFCFHGNIAFVERMQQRCRYSIIKLLRLAFKMSYGRPVKLHSCLQVRQVPFCWSAFCQSLFLIIWRVAFSEAFSYQIQWINCIVLVDSEIYSALSRQHSNQPALESLCRYF